MRVARDFRALVWSIATAADDVAAIGPLDALCDVADLLDVLEGQAIDGHLRPPVRDRLDAPGATLDAIASRSAGSASTTSAPTLPPATTTAA